MASISATLMASQASLSAARRRAVLAATIGNTLEWYDFLIYGFLAVTIAKLFFPAENELTSLLLSVGTFGAAGRAARRWCGPRHLRRSGRPQRCPDIHDLHDGFGYWIDRAAVPGLGSRNVPPKSTPCSLRNSAPGGQNSPLPGIINQANSSTWRV
jgi:hypothetical protein